MTKKIFSAVVCFLVLIATGAVAQENPQNSQEIAAKKIEPVLMQTLQAQGQADFFLHFDRQADLEPAYAMDWEARGWFVYDVLRKNADESQTQARKMLDAAGLEYVSFFTTNSLYVRGGGTSLALALAGLPEVAAVSVPETLEIVPPVIDEFQGAETQAFGDLAWGIIDTGADQFWQSYGSGAGIVVASIDTGVQWDHPALAGAYKCGADPTDAACWHDPSNICGAGGACDNNGHGTHVTGTMVGDNNTSLEWRAGMAPGATWIACKGCENNSCSEAALNSCADWIVAPNGNPGNRPHVVNNSWGGAGGNTWYLAKVNAWRAAGIFPAFSAGNEGSGCATIGSPGDYQESFASAAYASGGTIWSSSSRGPSAFGDTPYTKPNIAAPGANVCSSVPTDGWSCGYSGTSMASPHTAGAVALLWSCNPTLMGNIDLTFQILQGTADDDTPAGNCGAPSSGEGNYTYGYGYLDVLTAGLGYCVPGGILQGYVRNAADSTPIAGVQVSAAGGMTHSAMTDASGFYSLFLPVDTYAVTATAFGFLPGSVAGLGIIEGQTTDQDFLLDMAPHSTVSGLVEDNATGWPLYASIAIDGRPGDPVWSDPVTGAYSVSLPQGSPFDFTVSAFIEGYEPEERTVGPLTGDLTENFALDADLEECSAPGYFGTYNLQDFEADNGGYTATGTQGDWQWGEPVTWPSACASGQKCWGTKLNGNYSNNANEVLTSPVIDLSAVVGSLEVSWWQALHIESATFDRAYAEVSINGGPWQEMWQHSGGTVQVGWTERTYDISAAAGGTAQFRFRITTDGSVTYNGYYIDRVSIGTCGEPSGGIVVGNVFDANTGAGLAGALVSGDAGQEMISLATPDDPALPDGFYTLYSEAGTHAFEAALEGYGGVSHDVSVIAGTAVERDFDLPTGLLSADPESVSVTVALGQTATVPLTLTNSGGLGLEFDIRKSRSAPSTNVSIPRFTGSLPAASAAVSIDRAPASHAQAVSHNGASGLFPGSVSAEALPAYGMDLLAQNLVYIPDAAAPGTWTVIANKPGSSYYAGDFINGDFSTLYVLEYIVNQLHAVDTDTGAHQVIGSCVPRAGESWTGMTGGVNGVMYASSTDINRSTLYTIDLATGAATEIGQITNAPAIIDIAINPDLEMYGVDIVNDVLVRIDPQTGAGTVIGPIGFDASFAQGMDFEDASGVLYLAAYSNAGGGELRVADLTTGATTLIGAFPGGTEVGAFAFATTGGDVLTWVDVDPVSGTLAAGESRVIDVLFDADDPEITGAGVYEAFLRVKNTSPYGEIVIPVQMTVTECELNVRHKRIRSDRLTKPRKVALRITSEDEIFDIYGQIDIEPFTWQRVRFNQRKNLLRIRTIVPAGLAAGVYPISVGGCFGEVVVE